MTDHIAGLKYAQMHFQNCDLVRHFPGPAFSWPHISASPCKEKSINQIEICSAPTTVRKQVYYIVMYEKMHKK